MRKSKSRYPFIQANVKPSLTCLSWQHVVKGLRSQKLQELGAWDSDNEGMDPNDELQILGVPGIEDDFFPLPPIPKEPHPASPLKIFRVAHGLTQAQLAWRADITVERIGLLERRQVIPRLWEAETLARVLDTGPSVLFP